MNLWLNIQVHCVWYSRMMCQKHKSWTLSFTSTITCSHSVKLNRKEKHGRKEVKTRIKLNLAYLYRRKEVTNWQIIIFIVTDNSAAAIASIKFTYMAKNRQDKEARWWYHAKTKTWKHTENEKVQMWIQMMWEEQRGVHCDFLSSLGFSPPHSLWCYLFAQCSSLMNH